MKDEQESILDIKRPAGLWRLDHEVLWPNWRQNIKVDLTRQLLSREEFEHIFNLCDAIWLYKGKPSAEFPHALLANGEHSNGFFDCARVLRHSNLCQIMAQHMVNEFLKKNDWNEYKSFHNWIVGTATSSTDLSKDAANFLNCQHVPISKEGELQIWPKRHAIAPDETVFFFEELMTSSNGVRALREDIQAKHDYPIKFGSINVLVHRSDVMEVDGALVNYGFHYKVQNWPAEDCLFCAVGSEAIKPKLDDNWDRLHRR